MSVISVGPWEDLTESEGATYSGQGTTTDPWKFGQNSEFRATLIDGTLTVNLDPDWTGGTAELPYSGSWPYPWTDDSALAQKVTKIVIEGDIEKIGQAAFKDFSNLDTIDLSPSKVSYLEDYCFEDSTKLKMVIFPDIDNVTLQSWIFGVKIGDGEGNEYATDTGKDTEGNFAGKTFVWSDVHKMLCETLTHSVTYDVKGGDVSAPDKQKVAEGAKFNLASYDGKKEGFEFKGWDYEGTMYQAGYEMTMGEKDIVLTAVWKEPEIVYTVTFLLNGGEGSFPQMSCHPGDAITISSAEPTKDSCTFDGWDCDGVRYSAGQVVIVESNMTFTAQWKADGGSGPITPVTPVVPIFPGDEHEAVEIIADNEKDGSKDNDKTVLIIGIVVAIIAVLAVMSITKKE